MEKIKMCVEAFCSRFRIDKKLLFFIIIGFTGIFLLVLSEYIPQKENASEDEETKPIAEYTYAEEIEKKLTGIVCSINGAGKAKVMVTLENGVESVYAKDEKYENEKRSSDKNESSQNEKIYDEQEYILLDDGAGGLVIKVIQPKIRGVAVVCEGGDSVYVKQRITEAVSAVLDINSSRISITKMAEQTE